MGYSSNSISQVLTKFLTNIPPEDNPHHREGGIGHASMAGKCARQIWFLSHLPSEKKPQTPVMVFGKLIHGWLATYVNEKSEELGITSEVPLDFRPQWNLIGQADFLSEKTVGEVKTTKDYNIRRWWEIPKEQHILQASIYAYGFSKPYIELIYISRDTALIKTFSLPRRPGIESEIDRISSISQTSIPPAKITWKSEKLEPNRPWAPKTTKDEPWECRYCLFWKECLEIDKNERDYK